MPERVVFEQLASLEAAGLIRQVQPEGETVQYRPPHDVLASLVDWA